MGKGGTPKVEVTEYYMSEHFGICTGPVSLMGVYVKEKIVTTGNLTSLTSYNLDLPGEFGGVKKEGGLKGTVHYLPGASDQVLPDVLAQRLGRASGADCPGFRGIASLFFVGSDRPGFYWTANTPYLPGVWATVRRAPVGLDPSIALIPNPDSETILMADTALDANRSTVDGSDGLTFNIDPAQTLVIRKLAGLTYDAWSYTPADDYLPGNYGGHVWRSDFNLKDAEGEITQYWYGGSAGGSVGFGFTSSADAYDFTLGKVVTATGSASYTLFLYDASVDDNRGGFSAQVSVAGTFDANPAHIIYECLTNTDWGMGSPAAALDFDAFSEAAVTLYGEGFGLSMIWTRQARIEDFVQEVLDHIQAVLFVDPSTGLMTLKLIRGDYDAGALPEITPDNADLSNFSRKLWGEITNEIVVTWTNPENEQEETVTVQDLASIATQGGVVSDGRNYYGVRSAGLAQDLAFRDLRSAGQPLATCEAAVDRTQWRLRPASVVKVTWPEYGLSEVVMRVTSIDYGRPGDMTIKLALVEDVYGLDIGDYDAPPSSEWEDPSSPPEPIETVEIFTLPLFFAADTTVAAFVDNPEYPEVLAGILATTANSDTFGYELWDETALPNGSLEWQSLGTNNIIGRAVLDADLAAEASSAGVAFSGLVGQTSPTVGGFAIIGDAGETGNEIAMVEAVAGTVTLTRGVLDTVPRAWPAGTPAWFVDGSTLFEDSQVRSSGETVDYKLLSRTSRGQLALADAPLESATLTDRPWLPNRPANVLAYGEAWSSETVLIDARARPDPWVTVTWANRNRTMEDSQVLAWTDATMTPETGQTTRIEVLAADETPLATHDALAGTSFDVPDASFAGEAVVRLRIYADRTDADGDFTSLQFFEHWVLVATLGGPRVSEGADNRTTETGDQRITEE